MYPTTRLSEIRDIEDTAAHEEKIYFNSTVYSVKRKCSYQKICKVPTHLQCAKHQNKPLVRKASESKDVCPEMHTKGSGSYKEPSSKFRNERTSTCNSIRGFSEPSFFLTECDFCNTVFQIFPVKCLMNTVGAIIPAEMTRPPSEVPVPGLLQAPRSSQRVSFERHSLHCCGRARGQLDG